MKKIGEGYFYNVYDLGNGRVLKKQKNKIGLLRYIVITNCFLPRAINEYRKAIKNIPTIKYIYQGVIERFPSLSIFGNPVFLEGINYEQDKVLTIRQILHTQNKDEIQELLEKYITCIKELWRHGCHEKVFNFTINNGVKKDGGVILIDFNEISFDKNDVIQDIKKKTWDHRWSYTHLYLGYKKDLREFYSRRMSEELTLENLEALWEQALKVAK